MMNKHMVIRKANKFDVNKVLDLIKLFVDNSNLQQTIKDNIDYIYINQLYRHCVLGAGLILVAEQNDELVGVIVGIKSPNIWLESDITLREILFYVKPEYRNGRVAYKLIKEYNSIAQQLLEQKVINSYTMTKTEHLNQIDYSRFGYNKIEETWAIGI